MSISCHFFFEKRPYDVPPVPYEVSGANIKEADLRHSVEGHHTAQEGVTWP